MPEALTSGGSHTDEHAVLCESVRLLLVGQPFGVAELALATGLAPMRVQRTCDRLAARGLLRLDNEQHIIASWGLSRVPTEHAVTFDGQRLYGWCAEDALGIPAALRKTALITGACADCGAPVRIALRAGALEHVDPEGAQVWIGQPGSFDSLAES